MGIPEAILGRWHITWMEQWSKEDIDLLEPAFIEFDEKCQGKFTFICVVGYFDYRYSIGEFLPVVDFEWEGSDACDRASGDGWVEVQPDGTLIGAIALQDGDESEFKAEKMEGKA